LKDKDASKIFPASQDTCAHISSSTPAQVKTLCEWELSTSEGMAIGDGVGETTSGRTGDGVGVGDAESATARILTPVATTLARMGACAEAVSKAVLTLSCN